MLNQQPPPPARPLVPSRAEGTAGPVVGGYRLLTRIGEGGMGVVHLAQAPDGSRVALKVLRPHVVGDDESRERLAREVASLRRVSSPRVAGVIDADPWGDTPYVATRYVPGLSLHEHVRHEGVVTGRDLAHVASGLLEAVRAVHAVGVLHRDIKPSNVLLEGRSPVLIDFGLARLADDARLTQTGWLLGTPGYLAPEILYGDDATTASDVHSWAATMVFACTGRPPFGTGPAFAVMDRVRRGEHDLSGVPSALLPLVRSGLDPDPSRRPTTAELWSALRRAAPSPAPAPAPARDGAGDGRPDDALRHPDGGPRHGPRAHRGRPGADAHPAVDRADAAGGPGAVHAAAGTPPARPTAAGHGRRSRAAEPHDDGAVRHRHPRRGARAVRRSRRPGSARPSWSRTTSWTTESAHRRRRLRGRRRWYDVPMTVLSSPWYLLVAAAGTLALVLWTTLVATLVGLTYLLFGAPVLPGLVLTGASAAAAVWCGPGSRRLRAPTRAMVRGACGGAVGGWCVAVLVVAAAVACAYALRTGGPVWAPASGPPWRAGTVLGDLLLWL